MTIGAKTSSTGTIFGSVTNIQVAEALAKAGFENIDRKIIYIKESVKEVGSYKAVLKLHKRFPLRFLSRLFLNNRYFNIS